MGFARATWLLLWSGVLFLANVQLIQATSYCSSISPPVPPCKEPIPRDLLFIVDASNSMDRTKFYNEMLDYCLALFCAFDPKLANQAGMITFAWEIKVVIPLDQYTRSEWNAQVQSVKNDDNACCSCCTPTADAFDLAVQEFNAHAKNPTTIAFMITDGEPANNFADNDGIPSVPGINGNPAWWWVSASAGFNIATYALNIVPQSANTLKDLGHRLIIVGVPSKTGAPPDRKYFEGKYDNNAKVCYPRNGQTYCGRYNKPPFPIVSLPVAKNSFSTTSWNVDSLIALTVDSLCIPPTTTPTRSPTKQPTSKSPTSKTPTRSPTRRPTTKGPSISPTKRPTTLRPTSKTPTRSPTKRPTTKAPSKSPTKRPTTQRPSRTPTKRPTQRPTMSPTFVYMDQVDVTFLIDRSRSMRWHDDACRAIIENSPARTGVQSKWACWELFMRYALDQSDEFAKMPSGIKKNRPLRWHNEYPQTDTPRSGLRVNIVGFACANNQRTPRVFTWSLDKHGGPIDNRADLEALLDELRETEEPDGGTCAGLAIEQAIKNVEAENVVEYPLHAVVLITDGVFYDMPFPEIAVGGLEAYKVLRFSVGIAVAKTIGEYGLTQEEKQQQKAQLMSFVGNRPQMFKDLGEQGWEALKQVAADIAKDLPTYYFLGDPIPRYTWCGWRREQACAANNWRLWHCKWPNDAVQEWGCRRRYD